VKYAELNITFEDQDNWQYTEQSKQPMKFDELWYERENFYAEREKLKENLKTNILDRLDLAEYDTDVGRILDPPFEQYSKAFFMADHVDKDLLLKKANRNTLQKKLQEWCRQCVSNVEAVRNAPGASIFYNQLKNVPCVVVTAGPSLANNIELLKEVYGKCIIMSVDTSFRSLVKRGYTPTFVNTHDANANGAKFFDGIDAKDTVGLFVNYVHPSIVEKYQGPVCFYYVQDDNLPVYKLMALSCDKEGRKDGGFLKSMVMGGSSVAHTAYYLAILMGCNPITFIGLDLSYPDFERSHFETDNPKDVRSKRLINVEDIQGRMIKTDHSFYSYKSVFENIAPTISLIYQVKLFNSTESADGKPAGIVYQGLRPLRFRNFIDQFCTKERPEINRIKELYNSNK